LAGREGKRGEGRCKAVRRGSEGSGWEGEICFIGFGEWTPWAGRRILREARYMVLG